MKKNLILLKVYRLSAVVIVPVMLLICLLFKWHAAMIIITSMASLVISVPLEWRFIDCSFGLFGFITLWICYVKTKKIQLLFQS